MSAGKLFAHKIRNHGRMIRSHIRTALSGASEIRDVACRGVPRRLA